MKTAMVTMLIIVALGIALCWYEKYVPINGYQCDMDDAPKHYRIDTLVVLKIKRMNRPFYVENTYGTVTGKAGDCLVERENGFRWLLRSDVFEAKYKPFPADPDKWKALRQALDHRLGRREK